MAAAHEALRLCLDTLAIGAQINAAVERARQIIGMLMHQLNVEIPLDPPSTDPELADREHLPSSSSLTGIQLTPCYLTWQTASSKTSTLMPSSEPFSRTLQRPIAYPWNGGQGKKRTGPSP
jgi:hypothetical protein